MRSWSAWGSTRRAAAADDDDEEEEEEEEEEDEEAAIDVEVGLAEVKVPAEDL
jgi:hypothetical protein